MLIDESGIVEISEDELFSTWVEDELIQDAFTYDEYSERMKKTGVIVFDYINK